MIRRYVASRLGGELWSPPLDHGEDAAEVLQSIESIIFHSSACHTTTRNIYGSNDNDPYKRVPILEDAGM
jgi:hypothetical protein